MRHYFNQDGEVSISAAREIDAALKAVEAAVHSKYRPVRVRPWVLTTLGRPGEAMCTDLRRLARARLALGDVRDAVSLPSIMQYLLHRWRAELSCAMVLGDTEVYLEAVQGEMPCAGGVPRAEVQVDFRGRGSRRPKFPR